MNLLPMNLLGPRTQGMRISFGLFLPGVSAQAGWKLEVRIIHESDQLLSTCRSVSRPMAMTSVDPRYGELWSTVVDLSAPGSGPSWGSPGTYVYRYALTTPRGELIDWIIDPFAREFGTGRHAAVTVGYADQPWGAHEATWVTPRAQDLVMYEINVMEFAGNLAEAARKLPYLADLGVNCVSLMPITNITDAIDWGYTPIGYFGVDERFGDRNAFRSFVDAAHRNGIAVVVDGIYGHAGSLFAYQFIYERAGLPNPFMGAFSKDLFAPSVDWTRPFPQDFFFTVNAFWLEKFHVDGFRYDCVPNYWELGPDFRGFAALAYATHGHVAAQVAAGNADYARFADPGGGPLRLIQCAEQLEAVKSVLEQTFSTCTWQNDTVSAARRAAVGSPGALDDLGRAWCAVGLPEQATHAGVTLPKAPLQYVENHDQDRLICSFGVTNPDENRDALFEQGDRSRAHKVQPYLIGTLLARGIPLLAQGQELCENAKVAPGGTSRTGFLRIVHWEYFYDDHGRTTLDLVRRLLALRGKQPHLRDGASFFFNDPERYQHRGLMLFARYYPGVPGAYTLVALNVTDQDQVDVPFWFPMAGTYREQLHGGALDLTGVPAMQEARISVPSNYGRVWTHV